VSELGKSKLQKPGESLWRSFDRYILRERKRRERLSAELKWHEDRIGRYTPQEQERFKNMRKILEEDDIE